MKKIFKFTAMLITAVALLGCEKTPQDSSNESGTSKPGTENPDKDKDNDKEPEKEIDYTEDIEFSIELVSVEAESAKVKVQHNGTTDDSWYGFATTSTNVSRAIEDMVEELITSGDEIEGLVKRRSKTVTITDLKPDTQYNYIVFAITAEGDVYGTHSSIKFRTPIKFEENSAWKVEYTARGFVGENEYEHTVTVTSTDSNPYFMTIVTLDRFEDTDIVELLQEEVDAFSEFIDNFNAYYEVETTFNDWCYTGNAVDAFNLELGHTFVAMAIGVTSEGALTGHYAVSNEFQPHEEEMTEAYASWIGNWTFTGSNGVSFNVNFKKKKSNAIYVMTGWEGEGAKQHEVEVDWYESSNTWMLWSQYIGTFTSAGYGDFDLYFTAGKYDEQGEHVYMTDGLIICIGHDTTNGTKMVTGYSEDDKALYTHMRFAGLWSDGVGGITATSEFPTFPITVTPGPSTLSVDKEQKLVVRNAANIYVPQQFKAYDFQKMLIR